MTVFDFSPQSFSKGSFGVPLSFLPESLDMKDLETRKLWTFRESFMLLGLCNLLSCFWCEEEDVKRPCKLDEFRRLTRDDCSSPSPNLGLLLEDDRLMDMELDRSRLFFLDSLLESDLS